MDQTSPQLRNIFRAMRNQAPLSGLEPGSKINMTLLYSYCNRDISLSQFKDLMEEAQYLELIEPVNLSGLWFRLTETGYMFLISSGSQHPTTS